MEHYRYLILGGGVAAGNAAKIFADAGHSRGSVGIVSAENYPPYDRPPLSKKFMTGDKTKDDILINARDFYEEAGIDLRLECEATEVDLKSAEVTVRGGDKIRYEKLLIATGAKVMTLNLAGENDADVLYLRRVEDSEAIQGAADRGQRVLVLGAGFIAMEVAASLTQRGSNVTLAYPDAHVFPRLFTPQMQAFFERYYHEKGVTLKPRYRVKAFEKIAGGSRVEMESGDTLDTEVIVAGVGVAPGTDLFQTTGLKIENGICVNEYLETNVPGVFAAGDVANYYDTRYGQRRRVEHWQNAVDQGALAARNMTGAREAYRTPPYFFSDMFDLSWEFWGDTTRADKVRHVGKVEEGSFSVWWLKEGAVQGVFVLNRSDEERKAAKKAVAALGPMPEGLE